ncbi:MAG: porin family protein, partial [Prevotella sp.]
GAQADFNVKASTTVNGQKAKGEKDNIQLSLNGAMGVEYDFLPQVGLYIEPGLRYNIDNGSEVKTYFKKHDVDFNLQLGFRVNFGK